MPSPFPGMDPFLESPQMFPDFHDRFVSNLSESLMQSLPAPYYAALGRRAWVEVSERYIGPDVTVFRSDRGAVLSDSGGTAVAELPATEPIIIRVPHDERVEPFIEIVSGRGADRRIVTVIEVLSPSNKSPGEDGRASYLKKQREILNSKTHLLEIDLLRSGTHTTAVPKARLDRKITRCDYLVCLKQFDNLEDYLVYPISIRQVLPGVKIPLLPGDGDVNVSLQTVFDRTWDAGPYRREIDYLRGEVEPPLRSEDAEFIRSRVIERFGSVA